MKGHIMAKKINIKNISSEVAVPVNGVISCNHEDYEVIDNNFVTCNLCYNNGFVVDDIEDYTDSDGGFVINTHSIEWN